MATITVDWNVFNYKFSGKQRETFESLAYTLFCFEFKQKFGVFRYFNQPYIETQPITTEGSVIGFQAKYYDESTKIADKEEELKKAIRDAKIKYGNISRFIIYTNKELSASSNKTKVKPQYQINIEKCGNENGIEVEWRVPSNFEIMLFDPQLTAVKELYFCPNTELQLFAERIQKRTYSLIDSINSNIQYRDKTIKIEYPQKEIFDFTKSDNSVFVVYGNAGTGKSGFVKDFYEQIYGDQDSCLLMLSASDFDVKEETALFSQFGNYGLDGLLSLYDLDENKYCIIDSSEKYCNFFKTLPDNTLYYIEEYIFFYVNENIDLFQNNIPLKRKVINVLDFLVSKGSTMGFLLKEELV